MMDINKINSIMIFWTSFLKQALLIPLILSSKTAVAMYNALSGIQLHNEYRKLHHSQPLLYDATMTNAAQTYANYLVKNGLFQHGMLTDAKGRNMGQNLFAVLNAAKNDSEIVKLAVKNWYKESRLYDYNNPQYSPNTGHFTQLVWNSTNLIGIGIASQNNQKIVVANYYPPGNYQNKFRQNVFPI